MFAMSGSEEHKSIHGLEYAITCDTVFPGVNGVSTGPRGGMMGAGGVLLVWVLGEDSKLSSSER
jgi:hypothetical protein